jgi:hypothetical protein
MATINGTAVVFGYTGTNGIAITGINGTLLQSTDQSAEADHEDVRNAVGDIVSRAWYDQNRKATLEWVITGTGLANAITNNTLTGLTPGTIIVISACASNPDLVATNWEVMSSKNPGSNTSSHRMTVQLEKRAGITAVASA